MSNEKWGDLNTNISVRVMDESVQLRMKIIQGCCNNGNGIQTS
jgi:hypothetical protein